MKQELFIILRMLIAFVIGSQFLGPWLGSLLIRGYYIPAVGTGSSLELYNLYAMIGLALIGSALGLAAKWLSGPENRQWTLVGLGFGILSGVNAFQAMALVIVNGANKDDYTSTLHWVQLFNYLSGIAGFSIAYKLINPRKQA